MLFLLLLCVPLLCFAQTVTYTGYSEISQKAAADEALAGVAKQICATVTSVTEVSRRETKQGESTELSKNMKVQTMVKSSFFLRGLKIKEEAKKGNLYAATASINLKDLTSYAQLKLQEIKRSVQEKEALAKDALEKKSYAEAITFLESAFAEALPYSKYLEEISFYMPLDTSMLLNSNGVNLRADIIHALQGIELEVSLKDNEIKKDSLFTVSILVKDGMHALPKFPIILEHGKKRLALSYTDSLGIALFELPYESLESPPHVLKIIPGILFAYRNEAGISVKTVPYNFKEKSCLLNIRCTASPTLCAAISKKIKQDFNSIDSPKEIPVDVQITGEQKSTVKNLHTYDVFASFSDKNNSCTLVSKGVGKSETEAFVQGISKMDFRKCAFLKTMCEDK